MWKEKEKKAQGTLTHTGPRASLSEAPYETHPVTPIIPNYSTEGSKIAMTETTLKTPIVSSTNHRQTLLGSSVILKGELSGDEDLTIEGQFDGSINLKDNCLTIGQNGQVKADINARQVVISGKLSGKVNARDKVEIHRTGNVVGDLITMGVAIEEGAYFKGSIEILREEEEARSKVAASSWTA
jgi:cytoskeletal protein CcmA (bactofilin family)